MKAKKSQLNVFTILSLILTSVFVGATVINESINETISNITSNESINKTSINEKQFPAINDSSLIKTIKLNKNKLNKKTEDYLKEIVDKTERKTYIVKFRESIDKNKLINVNLRRGYQRFNSAKIEGSAADIEELLSDSEIEYIELDQKIEILSENIPYGVAKTNAPSVWNSVKGADVRIAVLDTGISPHPDLIVMGGTSVIGNDYTDTNGHGTVVIGVVSALLDNRGLVGVAPEAEIYAVKIMESNNGDLSDAIGGVEWTVDNAMNIISMSFGMEAYSQIFKEVLREAYEQGVLIIAAAGNNGENNILYPAAYSDVIAVGAADENNNRASFSSYGYELELTAPGVNINSTSLSGDYSLYSGTSTAVPHVVGAAALIKSHNQELSNEQIRAKLRNDALDLGEEGKDDYFGYGLVQVNLEADNFTLQNESYFYEVFNITDYGTSEINYEFWLSGNGTIDDVGFVMGYYLIKKYFSRNITMDTVYVAENGTIILLYTNTISFFEDFMGDGSDNDDGIVWVNGNLAVTLSTTNPNPQAECYDTAGGQTFEYCFAESGSDMDDCDDSSSAIDCSYTDCDSNSNIGGYHEIFDTSFPKSGSFDGEVYYNCNPPSADHDTTNSLTSYVIDKKRGRCTNSTHFVYEGHYGSGNWVEYQDAYCGSSEICDTTQDDEIEYTDKAAHPDPCYMQDYCSGKIEVDVTDSYGKPINGSYVYLNGAYNDKTNTGGQKILSFTDIDCGVKQNISIYCYNNQSRLCDEKRTALDFDGDYDSLIFDCNLCNEDKDLSISLGDVNINKQNNQYNISITIHSENINTNNLNISFRGQDRTSGLTTEETDTQIPLIKVQDTALNASVLMNLSNINYIHIYIDPNNQVNEPKDNNYVLAPAIKKKITAYLNVSTGIEEADEAIEAHLKFFIDSQPEDSGIYSTKIFIGKKNARINQTLNSYTLNNFGWGIDDESGLIKYNNHYLSNKPYVGLVGKFYSSIFYWRPFILVYGNDIEGDVAAVKALASHIEQLARTEITNQKTIVLDDYDTLAISVFDLMHNNESNSYYRQNNENFKKVVERILTDNNYEVSIKTVKTYNDNTTLRLKHANSDFSQNYKDAVVNASNPVILQHGIHSDITSWNDFANKLAQSGRNAWIIEAYGGPITEDCEKYSCPNYTFYDLKHYYWPALISGVEAYSGQNKADYVGYDLGCTMALESLENYSSGKNNAGYYFDYDTGEYAVTDLAANPIETFVGVACLGNFTKTAYYSPDRNFPPLVEYISKHDNDFKNNSELFSSYKGHLPGGYYRSNKFVIFALIPATGTWYVDLPLAYVLSLFDISPGYSSGSVSMQVYQDLISWMDDTVDPDVGEGVTLDNFAIIQSIYEKDLGHWGPGDPWNYNKDTDYFVAKEDQLEICKNVNSNNKYYLSFKNYPHFDTIIIESMVNYDEVQREIINFLNAHKLEQKETFEIISTDSNCE